MTTSVDIVNGALELIAAQTTITGLNDGTTAGDAAGVIYAPTVLLLLRQQQPDFARAQSAMTPTGNITPPIGYAHEYFYPDNCARVRAVLPPAGYDPFDPQPIRYAVMLDVVSNAVTKVIATNQANAVALFTWTVATEDQWDSVFTEAVKRQLANPLSMALAGRPDFARELLEEAARYEQLAETSDESVARMT